ncbi:MAG: aldehyde ferredoxin oxidoreductase family protein [Halobacteria archaeon]
MMFQIGGCWGKLLRVNLTSEKIEVETIKKEVFQKFLGGKGLGAYLLYNELPKGVDPLSQENKLAFLTGPLTGTALMGNRFAVCTKSPLTNAWLDSHCGGFWGVELKFAGFDGIIMEGRSKAPVYLTVFEEEVQLHDAEILWGLDTFETERLLKKKYPGARVLSIGQAGEKQALIASIMADTRAAARGGSGAVMGSKNLKAIAVRGSKKPEVASEAKVAEVAAQWIEKLKASKTTSQALPNQGTLNIIEGVNYSGGLPTRNYQTGRFEGIEEISGEAYQYKLWGGGKHRRACWHCPVACIRISKTSEGKAAEGPEYQTVAQLGANCGIADRDLIARADYYADAYGMDTISLGNTLAFLMECFEKGLLKKEEIDDVKLEFGNKEAYLKAIHAAGTVTGNLGKLIASGVKRASEKIGRGSEKFAMHVKGLEIPGYDPRGALGQALAYAVADRGACHLRPWTYGSEHLGSGVPVNPKTYEDKPKLIASGQRNIAVLDSLGICQFITFAIGFGDLLNMLNAVTGFNYTRDEFRIIGERINTLTRSFNCREGFDSKDDTLPYRALNESLDTSVRKGEKIMLEKMLPSYYESCGWDERGMPLPRKLEALKLDFVEVK